MSTILKKVYLFSIIVETTLIGASTSWAQNIIQLTGQNVFAGNQVGSQITTGVNNLAIGYQAGTRLSSGPANVFLGSQSGFTNTTGSSNVFSGALAGYFNTSGSSNVFIGAQSGVNNTTGSFNMFMGNSAGGNNIVGNNNMGIGDGAGFRNNANQNTFIGTHAGFNSQSGSNNVFIGQDAAQSIISGGSNVFIGWQANSGGSNAASLTNAIAIGANAIVNQSNSMVLGSGVNIGIGTSTPGSKLEIVSGASGISGLRLTNIGTTATALNQTKFLTVNSNGDVVLGSPNSTGRMGSDLWEANGEQVQNTNTGVVIIGQKISKTPAGYKLFVEQGILTERVKVAVKNTTEWSDHVFASSYYLPSLQEVERYIKVYKHLFGIPTATEMIEQGNDLHKTDAKLLEKIEELTLYSIQLEKSRQQQQAELDELKKVVKQLLKRK